jgi:hypothetical protein
MLSFVLLLLKGDTTFVPHKLPLNADLMEQKWDES